MDYITLTALTCSRVAIPRRDYYWHDNDNSSEDFESEIYRDGENDDLDEGSEQE